MKIPYHYIRNAWYVAGFSHEFVSEKPQGHKIAGRPFVIWRTREGQVAAFDNRCAHKRMPLSEGRILNDGTLECAYHGLRYDSSGRCVAIPAHPDGPIPPQAKLKPFPAVEQDGLVWIWPGDATEANALRPPPSPELTDHAWESVGSDPLRVKANYLLLIENLMDITHFYPLHDGNIGDIANSRIPVELVEGDDGHGNHYVKTIRKVNNYRQPPFLVDWFGYDVVDREHTHCSVSPGVTRVEMRVAPPGKLGTDAERGYVLHHFHTPVDDRNHVWRWCMSTLAGHKSGADPSKSVVKRATQMFPEVVKQDLWVLEKQQEMYELQDEGYVELYLRTDKALRRVRQLFSTMQRKEVSQPEEPTQVTGTRS